MKNLIKTITGVVIFFAIYSSSSVISSQAIRIKHSGDEAKLKHLKKVLWKRAYRDQDTKLLDQILAKEFQVIFDDGKWSDKASELEYIRKNKPTYISFEYKIKRLEIFENGTAIIAGEGHVVNKDNEYRYQSSNVLIKRNGEWKAISSHVSGVNRRKL